MTLPDKKTIPDRWKIAITTVVVALMAFLTFVLVEIGDDDPPPTTTTVAPTTTTVDGTTTTQPPTTTTSVPPTTTMPPTTTSTTPPTTTTAPPVDLPAAIDCRAERIDRFDIISRNADFKGDIWHVQQYCRSLPYEDGRYWWVDGDRNGYACAYAFSNDDFWPNGPGVPGPEDDELQIRVTFSRPPDVGYAALNDDGMLEGQLTYAGHPSLVGGREIADCPIPVDATYDPEDCLEGGAPILALWHDHHLIDVRDYVQHANARDDVDFCILENITEPFVEIGPGRKAPGCPNLDNPGWGCEPHRVEQRMVVGTIVDLGSPEGIVIPQVIYYDAIVPAARITNH